MSEHEPLMPELKAIETALASLRPAAAAIDRDRLMYEAGRAAARPRHAWVWPSATTLCAAAALWLAARSPVGIEKPINTAPPLAISRETPTAPNDPATFIATNPSTIAPPPTSYIRLRNQLADADVATIDFSPAATDNEPPAASPPDRMNRRDLMRHLN